MNPEPETTEAPTETKPEYVISDRIKDLINTEKLQLDEQLKTKVISLRALVTSKDAGAIIGKGGKNVKEVRESTGVKAGITAVVEGVTERVLTVTGNLDSISMAYALFATYLIDNNNIITKYGKPLNRTIIHLIVSHQLIGSIIGKNGDNIKEIHEVSKAHIVASKELLPQSTERVIEISGTAESIHVAVYRIIVSILKDYDKVSNVILFKPIKKYDNMHEFFNIGNHYTNQKNGYNAAGKDHRDKKQDKSLVAKLDDIVSNVNNVSNVKDDDSLKPLTFKVPSKFVGCTIGKGGSKIAEIRKISGTKISISPVKEDYNEERTFTIVGTEESKEKALSLIYELLLEEKEKIAKREAAAAAAAAAVAPPSDNAETN